MRLQINNLNKTYSNGVQALKQLSLEMETGMFGLLGPNGAGKSTLMRTLATLQLPDSGEIHFDGVSILDQPMEIRKVLGYLPQEFGAYPNMSGEKLLDYLALLKGIISRKERSKMIDYVLELTNLQEARSKHVVGYSGGMRQRFGIAQLLLNDPKLIIVDEPTAGLDPAERHRFLHVLRQIATDNMVLFSTHIVEDVSDLCTDMAIINTGSVFLHDTPASAISKYRDHIWTKIIGHEEEDAHRAQYQIISTHFTQDHKLLVRVFCEVKPAPDFEPSEPGLEDVYFIALQ